MQIRGPLATLLAVVVAAAAVVATNLVLTDGPAPERTASLDVTRSADGYGGAAPDAAAGAAVPAPQAGDTAPAAPRTGAPEPASYDGRTAGGEVTVALTISDGGAATAYVCDGKGLESWMRGTVQGSDVTLTGQDGAALDGRTQDGAAFGTVQVGGTSRPFAAAATPDEPDTPEEPTPSGNAPTGGWS